MGTLFKLYGLEVNMEVQSSKEEDSLFFAMFDGEGYDDQIYRGGLIVELDELKGLIKELQSHINEREINA